MTVDVKWHYAMAIATQEFDAAEREAGWPESMKLGQLAALQRPWVKGDSASNRLRQVFFYAIQQASTAGELANESLELTLYKTESKPGRRIRSTGIGGHVIEPATFNVPVPYQAHVQFVTAAAFAEWLRTQGEEPSQYIAHWFKVQGVAAPTVLQLASPAPAVDDAAKAADSPTKRPTTWDELIPWPDRKAKGFEWPDDLRLIVVRESQRRHGLGHPGVTAAMAKEFECTDRNMRKVIAGKGGKDSRGRVLALAAASLSNGTDGGK